jgi:hypothetical protein
MMWGHTHGQQGELKNIIILKNKGGNTDRQQGGFISLPTERGERNTQTHRQQGHLIRLRKKQVRGIHRHTDSKMIS